MSMLLRQICRLLALMVVSGGLATATTITIDWPPQISAVDLPYGTHVAAIPSRSFGMPTGEVAQYAYFEGTWGAPGYAGTEAMDVLVNGVTVGSCHTLDPCNSDSGHTFFYTFTQSDLLSAFSGSGIVPVDLEMVAREVGVRMVLGSAQLTIVTTPEPAGATLAGIGLLGLSVLAAFRKLKPRTR
jgi:hypothetical protein